MKTTPAATTVKYLTMHVNELIMPACIEYRYSPRIDSGIMTLTEVLITLAGGIILTNWSASAMQVSDCSEILIRPSGVAAQTTTKYYAVLTSFLGHG